jgi:hypothetical protein
MFKISPAHRCRSLRSERQDIVAPVLKSIHLFGNDIGAFAYTPGKKLSVLKSWRIEALVSIKAAQTNCPVFSKSPVTLLFG